MRSIAKLLGRAPSTVSREIKRNGGYDRYRAAAADENAWRRGRRPKGCKLTNNRWLRRTVARKLESDWSPEQIAGWLKRAYPEDEHYQVSHETIYRSLYVQARGVLKKELIRHLRSKRTMRRPRRAGDKRGQIVDLVSISKRPATVEDRAVPGHWEGDLLSGSKNSYIATLVERQTRYVTLTKVANNTQTEVSALIKQAKTIPNELYKSLTWDRGKELADHRRLTLATNIDVYFCDPQSPGSVVPMKTPTVCFGSICRRGLTCPCTRKPSSTKWLGSSTNDHARLWDLQPQPNDLMFVLHRPLEPAEVKRTKLGRVKSDAHDPEQTSRIRATPRRIC